MAIVEILGDAPAHGEAAEMRARGAEMIEHAQEIVAEVAEIERSVIVLAVAIAARIPGNCGEIGGEDRKLVAPIAAIAADAVQEDEQRSAPFDIDSDARARLDAKGALSRQIDRLSPGVPAY